MLFAPIPSCFLARFLASRVENVRFDALLAHPCTTTRLAPCTTNMHTCPRILMPSKCRKKNVATVFFLSLSMYAYRRWFLAPFVSCSRSCGPEVSMLYNGMVISFPFPFKPPATVTPPPIPDS